MSDYNVVDGRGGVFVGLGPSASAGGRELHVHAGLLPEDVGPAASAT